MKDHNAENAESQNPLTQISIYSARDLEKHGPRLALKFHSQEMRDLWIEKFLKEARKMGEELKDIFDTKHDGSTNVVYIKASKDENSRGTYILDEDKSNPKLSIKMGNARLPFRNALGIYKQVNLGEAGAVVLDPKILPPKPDGKTNITVHSEFLEEILLKKERNKTIQKTTKAESYISWLTEQGVQKVFELSKPEYKHYVASAYIFDSEQKAKDFQNKFLSSKIIYEGDLIKETNPDKWLVTIGTESQKFLKHQYLIAKDQPLTLKQCDEQLKLIEEASRKITSFNKVELYDETKITRANYGKVINDRITNVADMLSNQKDNGWYFHAASSAIDIMVSIYKANDYNLLSEQEKNSLEKAHQQLLQVDKRGNFVGGLKADANFASYITEQFSNPLNKETRVNMIRENTESLLNGGQRKVINNHTKSGLNTLNADINDRDSYKQPGFFPDKTGKSETDTLVLQAGGMAGHSSMRVLNKEKDETAPGGYKYFYTKIDAGAGAEEIEFSKSMGKGIYTTEITPYYKTKQLANGKLAIVSDDRGNPIKMDEKEKEELKKNPEKYRQHMEATLFSLISAEREILFYEKNKKSEVYHGEATAKNTQGFGEWGFQNNRINGLRGEKVEEKCRTTPLQLSGNCTVYSTMLTLTYLTNESLGYDMLQAFKTYNEHDVKAFLNKQKEQLEREKQKLLNPHKDIDTSNEKLNKINSTPKTHDPLKPPIPNPPAPPPPGPAPTPKPAPTLPDTPTSLDKEIKNNPKIKRSFFSKVKNFFKKIFGKKENITFAPTTNLTHNEKNKFKLANNKIKNKKIKREPSVNKQPSSNSFSINVKKNRNNNKNYKGR